MQKACLLDRTAALPSLKRPLPGRRTHAPAPIPVAADTVVQWVRGCEVRDVFRQGVLGADGCDATFGGFAGFGEGVVA